MDEMEIGQEDFNQEDVVEPPTKKVKRFSAKEFRKNLITNEKIPALNNFLELCKTGSNDCIFQYLESGGNLLEIFKLIELNQIPTCVILEVSHYVLLEIVKKYLQYKSSADEACRYFLNTHLNLINQMLYISSKAGEKKLILKLLTVIVTLSVDLAKHILLHVRFSPPNLEVLCSHKVKRENVRNAMIHFVVAFLVDGDPNVIMEVNKKGLLASIIKGSLNDSVESVCIIMTSLKNHVLQNFKVSKTTKMKLFNTMIIKEIVNLYNWKGPYVFQEKKKLQTAQVDEKHKSQVNEAVHGLLLVLCTSRNQGIIFRDHNVGLSNKCSNNLMLSVLDSMEKPWEHSYASELTIQICKACPDLVKIVWNKLVPYLIPRSTSTWLSAIKYASTLVKELDPLVIQFCFEELSMHKLFQVVQSLIMPTTVLKTIVSENYAYESVVVKHNVLVLLVEMTTTIQKYLNSAKQWLNLNDFNIFMNLINEHICKHFPNSLVIFKDWKIEDEDSCTALDHVGLILRQLSVYQYISPQLLESFSNINLESFLEDLNELSDKETISITQVKAIKLFVNLEPSLFDPKKKLFKVAMSLAINQYFKSKSLDDREVLVTLLESTGVFDGCREEIFIWTDAIFETDLCLVLIDIVRETSKHLFKYLDDLSKISSYKQLDEEPQILENILNNLENGNRKKFEIKHQNLTPLLLGAFEYVSTMEEMQEVKSYLNCVVLRLFHFQTNLALTTEIILNKKYKKLVSKSVIKYVKAWGSESKRLTIPEGCSTLDEIFSSHFLTGQISQFFEEFKDIQELPGQWTCLLHQALFYITQNVQETTATHLENFEEFMKFLISKGVDECNLAKKILCNPNVLNIFKSTLSDHKDESIFNTFLVRIVEKFQNNSKYLNSDFYLEEVLKPYKWELYSFLSSLLTKPKKVNENTMSNLRIVEVFQLDYEECIKILDICAKTVLDPNSTQFLHFYYKLLTTSLKIYLKSNPEPVDIIPITRFLVFLNKECPSFDSGLLAQLLVEYFTLFPHSIKTISSELFECILHKTEFCKDNALLANFLLTKRDDFLNLFVENLDSFTKTKGLMLSLISASVSLNPDDEILQKIYQNFKHSILKGLEKPQKAGKYFAIYSKDVSFLITKFISQETCLPFIRKVQKFEVSEPFHLELLIAIFLKSIQEKGDYLNNAILTVVHFANSFFKKKGKTDEEWSKLDEVIELSNIFYNSISSIEIENENSFKSLRENEAFQMYCKFCLKYGLSGRASLINLVNNLIKLVNFNETESRLLFNMTSSHSEFLEILLESEDNTLKDIEKKKESRKAIGVLKVELLNLILNLCERWPVLMQKSHIPILLASYEATIKPTDRLILILLQMYEKAAEQTNFYDFKPFVWGHSAISHYSIRHDIQTALFRHAKMGEILDNIQEDIMLNTICNYSLKSTLNALKNDVNEFPSGDVYDFTFLFTIFNFLLAPENETVPYKFIQCGGLSMTVSALSSNDENTRKVAINILRRFNNEIEGKGNQKNKFVWLHFVEALCNSYSALDNAKLNNFASIFWARMALILLQPSHVMYVPLSKYLGIKSLIDLNSIPELYTFLHSSDVNYREIRTFILEVIRDGLRTTEDFSVALSSMSFKLIMELFTSCVAGTNTKVLILSILQRACKLKIGRNILCGRHGLLSWLFEVVVNLTSKDESLLSAIIDVMLEITSDLKNLHDVNPNQISIILTFLIDNGAVLWLSQSSIKKFLQVVVNVMQENAKFLNRSRLDKIISLTSDSRVKYYLKYECGWHDKENCDTVADFVQFIVTKFTNK